jgi:hypothetical protein
MIYQWNDDLNIVTQQTEESKRAGEILENLKLGCISSKGSSDTYIYTDTIDIDNIPDTLTNAQVDLHNAVGSGSFKTAYNLNGQPDLLMVLLESGYKATEIKKEIRYLRQLEALGIQLTIFSNKPLEIPYTKIGIF